MKLDMRYNFLLLLIPAVFLIITANNSAEEIKLQERIDSTQEGGHLYLQKGKYRGNFEINKPITIIMEEGTVLTPDDEDKPLFLIEQTNNVTLVGGDFVTSGTAIVGKKVEKLQLSSIALLNVFSGVEIYQSSEVEIHNVLIEGNRKNFALGNGLAFYNCSDLHLTNNTVNHVQDGVYIEGAQNILVSGNDVENSRYGAHLMFSKSGVFKENTFEKNKTGLMVMMTSNLQIENNDLKYQVDYNGTGITLYDTRQIELENNRLSGNRIGLTIQKSNNIKVKTNTFLMNQTAVEAIKSEQMNQVNHNRFVGNLVNCRTDAAGILLMNNYYDDYSGFDINNDGMGDEPYVALQSFGQWMVRKPVYQYYVEHPSVVLLNQIDKQINKGSQILLVDHTPLINDESSKKKGWKLNGWQLSIGVLLLVISLLLFGISILPKYG